MLKNILIFVAIVASFFGILLIIKNWDKIMAWWNRPNELPPAEGSECQTEAGIPGTIVNGVCVPPRSIPEPPPASVLDLQVSNPNGAFMYYQSPTASGGMNYSKSNFSLPSGTKLKLVKVWQTNVSTQPFSGYYETNYKQYGPQSGFFDTNDFSSQQRNLIGLGSVDTGTKK